MNIVHCLIYVDDKGRIEFRSLSNASGQLHPASERRVGNPVREDFSESNSPNAVKAPMLSHSPKQISCRNQ